MSREEFIRSKALDIIRDVLVDGNRHEYQFDAVREHVPRRRDKDFREYREGILGPRPEKKDDCDEMVTRMNREVDTIIRDVLEHIDGMEPGKTMDQARQPARRKDGTPRIARHDGYDRFRDILAGRLGSLVTHEFSRDEVMEECFENRAEQERFLAWAETLAENELADFIRIGPWQTWIRAEVKDQWRNHLEGDKEERDPDLDVLRSMTAHEEKELVKRFEEALASLDVRARIYGKTFTEIVNELARERGQRKEAIEKKAGQPVSRVEALSLQLKEAGLSNRIWSNPSRPDRVRVYLTLPATWLEPGAGHPKPRVNAYLEYGVSPIGKAADEPYDGSPHVGNDALPRITTEGGSRDRNLDLMGKLGDVLVKKGIISPARIEDYVMLTRGRTFRKQPEPGKETNPASGMKP